MDKFRQFNKYMEANKDVISKALTSATGVGGALIPENLEQIITDTVIRLSPELAMVFQKKISGKIHEFNKLVQRPGRGGALGENATTPITNSKTERDTVTLKVVRRKGKVTNFLIDTSEEYIDAAAYEMENHLQAHILDMIWYIIWGNENANSYEFNGLEQLVSSNRVAYSSAAGGAVPTNLSFLDDMIDASNRKGGGRHKRAILMSPEMLSKVSQLLTNVRLNQGLVQGGLTQIEINGGWRLNAYRDIPIIETTSLSPIETLSSTVTATPQTTGGSLADDTYYVRVAPVTYEGEQGASAESTVVVSGGTGNGSIDISLDAVHQTTINGVSVNSALAYKIYIGTTAGAENLVLVKHVSAFTYDAEGSPSDDNMLSGNEVVITTLTPSSDVPTHMQADIPFVIGGSNNKYAESIVLWDLDPIQGLGKLPYTNQSGDQFNGLVTTKQLAETDDFINFLVKSYAALCPSFEGTSYWLRNIRVA
jgi:hypothetical protein